MEPAAVPLGPVTLLPSVMENWLPWQAQLMVPAATLASGHPGGCRWR